MIATIVYRGVAPDIGAGETAGVAPPPPPVVVDVPLAIAELKLGLDNLVSQLRYSVDKAKRTHFYKALRALGGSWR